MWRPWSKQLRPAFSCTTQRSTSGASELAASSNSRSASAKSPRRRNTWASSACAITIAWNLIEGLPNQPHLWVPQPVNPTTYCEVEWGGMYARWSAAAGNTDFPAGSGGQAELTEQAVDLGAHAEQADSGDVIGFLGQGSVQSTAQLPQGVAVVDHFAEAGAVKTPSDGFEVLGGEGLDRAGG